MTPTDRDILENSYYYHHRTGPSLDKALQFNSNPSEICYKIKKLEKQGYLNYKLNIFTAWLTDKGKEYLKNLLKR